MPKANEVTISHHAYLAAQAIQRMEKAAAESHACGMLARSLQLVSEKGKFQAVIRHGKTTIEIQDGAFAVTQGE